MQFLRTVFWVILAVAAVVFAFNNWTPVTVRLWSDIVIDFQLPVLLLIVFLLGLIPPWLLHRITRWSMGRKLDAANRTLIETRNVLDPAHATPPPTPGALPPGAAPIAPPPGVA
jgi:lipopolysaccharide assembly protein A